MNLPLSVLDIGTDASPNFWTGSINIMADCVILVGEASIAWGILINTDCEAELDKQVSCDGGLTWFDAQFDFPGVVVPDDPDGTSTESTECIGWNAFNGQPAEPIMVRYLARNTGDLDLTCDGVLQGLADTNPELLPGIVPINMPPGTGGVIEQLASVSPLCSNDLDAGEPGTAMLDCVCDLTGQPAVDPDTMATPVDSALFECQTPALGVSKLCDPQDAEGNNAIDISYNDDGGDTSLVNCMLTDTVWSLACDGDGPDAAASVVEMAAMEMPVPLPDNNVMLEATTLNEMDCEGNTCCNVVEVTCDIEGSGDPLKQISATAVDDCEILEDDCYTRTPGRWGTHPADQDFVYDEFGPVESCGVDLETSDATMEGSGTEDVCSIGKDHVITGVSNTQLQVERLCAAANLNLAASQLLGFSCESVFAGITDLVDDCCNAADSVCVTGVANAFTVPECIDMLDVFNNMMFGDADAEPIVVGPANPRECRVAKKNGFLNGGGVRPH